jgi:hypothetical protein
MDSVLQARKKTKKGRGKMEASSRYATDLMASLHAWGKGCHASACELCRADRDDT